MSENENPNKLFIIGNGFDLAHGLKTKYEDFLLWYLNKYIRNADKSFDDGILKINLKLTRSNEFVSIQEFKDFITCLENVHYEKILNYTHPFIEKLFEKISQYNWVDIEQEYYDYLVKLFRNYESKVNLDNFYLNVQLLNNHFSCIKEKFKYYISNYLDQDYEFNIEIFEKIKNVLEFKKNDSEKLIKHVLFLNFNYTHTIDKYFNAIQVGQEYDFYYNLNIHGSKDYPDDIIFGYGDEDDSYYEKLEKLNKNEVLNHFKSFGYLKNDNYQKVNLFLDDRLFDVYIMGHSCGISDRVLLSTIFSHPNCNKIQIFYHQKSETENDFFEKTQQISRHLKAGMKNEMRKRIVPFNECKPLVSFKK